jgi:hypothetical protein
MPSQIIGLPEFSSVLFQIVMAAFIVERALALIFEWDVWDFLVKHAPWLAGAKEVIAFGTSYIICQTANFDALKTLFNSNPSEIGRVITALVIAGGSKGAMKLMQDVWKIKNVPDDSSDDVTVVNVAKVSTTMPTQTASAANSTAREGKL